MKEEIFKILINCEKNQIDSIDELIESKLEEQRVAINLTWALGLCGIIIFTLIAYNIN